MTGLRPFFSPEEAAKGNIQWFDDDWDNLTGEARDLVIKLLTVDVKERISARDALKHPWFDLDIAEGGNESEDEESGDDEGHDDGVQVTDYARTTHLTLFACSDRLPLSC